MLDASLRDAVVADPADDAVRLICADWLEEHGDLARAEFVRLQCRIAALEATCGCGSCVKRRGGGQHHNGPCAVDQERNTLPNGHSKLAFLRNHENGLLTTRGDDWFRADRGMSPSVPLDRNVWMYRPVSSRSPYRYWLGYRRGFLATFDGPLQNWLDCGGELVRWYPMGWVEVRDKIPHNTASREWVWGRGAAPNEGLAMCYLPADLYDHLPHDSSDEYYLKKWSSRASTKRALSVACLAWARSQVNASPRH